MLRRQCRPFHTFSRLSLQALHYVLLQPFSLSSFIDFTHLSSTVVNTPLVPRLISSLGIFDRCLSIIKRKLSQNGDDNMVHIFYLYNSHLYQAKTAILCRRCRVHQCSRKICRDSQFSTSSSRSARKQKPDLF